MKPLNKRTKDALQELIEFWNLALKEGVKPEEQRLLDKMK